MYELTNHIYKLSFYYEIGIHIQINEIMQRDQCIFYPVSLDGNILQNNNTKSPPGYWNWHSQDACSCRHLDCVNFSTLVVILYCCFARCFHLEKLDKRCTDLSALFHLSECESLSHNKSLTYKYDLLIHTLIHFYLVCYESTNVWVNMWL